MAKRYVGIDLHRRRSVIFTMNDAGEKLSCVRIANDATRLLEEVGAAEDCEVVIEATYGWYWVTDFSLNSDGTNALSGAAAQPTATPTKTAAAATATPTKTATKGSATATPTRTPTKAPASVTAAITSPVPGSKLTSTSATFKWNSVSGATKYQLYIGTTAGGYNLKNVVTTGTSLSVSGLPRGGGTIYVRLWTQVNGTWKFVDYTYTSAR